MSNAQQTSQNIQVAVRCRPLNDREKKANNVSVIECNEKRKEISVFDKNSPVSSTKTFTFDKVFGITSKQIEVYNQVVRPVVNEVIEGYNCTIFAYGQTGTGKTFTMEGDRTPGVDELTLSWEDDPLVGIIPRSVNQLFNALSMSNCEYSVKISFIELYNEEVSDLLSESIETEAKLRIYDDANRKGSVIIPGLEEIVVKNKSEVYKILQKGAEKRQKASTLMNSQSSRSHSIFTVTVFIKEKSIEGEEIIKVGKLNLVDLAGSENIERSGATGKRAAEAGKINKSLTTLGRVITALVEHRDHIPYRESNLTRLLQDSLGGRTKTTIIATISPALCNIEETLSTLDYAHKAKSIRNKPEINQKLVKKALIKEYTEEIEKLKRELMSTREKNGIYLPEDIYQSMETKLDLQKEEIRENLLKISGLNEEIEKLNELFHETKLHLEDKCMALNQTRKQLNETEAVLDATKQECAERKYLLDEQVRNEDKLYGQAQYLLSLSKETKADCKGLHEKLARVCTTTEKNRLLTDMFSKEIVMTFEKMIECSGNNCEQNKSYLCGVCELLADIGAKLTMLKEDSLHQLTFFEEKQTNWLTSQESFVKKSIEESFLSFYEEFIKTSYDHYERNALRLDKFDGLCVEHKHEMQRVNERLMNKLSSMSESGHAMSVEFGKKSDEFTHRVVEEISHGTAGSMNKLAKLEESMKDVRGDLNELYTKSKQCRVDFHDTISSFEQMIKSFSAKMGQTFDSFGEKYDELLRKTDSNMAEIGALKSQIEKNESSQIDEFKASFESKIGTRIRSFLDTQLADLDECIETTDSMAERNSEMSEKMAEQIGEAKSAQMNDNTTMNTFVTMQLNNLDKDCKKLQSHFHKHKQESSQFVAENLAQPIDYEVSQLTGLIEKSAELVKTSSSSIEHFADETKSVLTNNIHVVNQFAETDYQIDAPTGQTPKPKSYNTDLDLVKTRAHAILLDEFRNKQTPMLDALQLPLLSQPSSSCSSLASTSPKKVSDTLTSLPRSQSDLRAETKTIEAAQQVKRQYNDKENYVELNTKQQAKIKSAPPNKKAFHEKIIN